jgi:hypothetical protein
MFKQVLIAAVVSTAVLVIAARVPAVRKAVGL